MISNKDTHIAGVTFCNDAADGGENRQDLLKQLYGHPSVVELQKCIFHNTDTNQDELAIKILSRETGRMLGYIPKNDIPRFASVPLMILQVSYYKNVYGGSLTLPTPPTAKQYSAMKQIIYRNGGQLPMYDKLIYQYVIANA